MYIWNNDILLFVAFVLTLLLSVIKLPFLFALLFTIGIFLFFMFGGMAIAIAVRLLMPDSLIKSARLRVKILALSTFIIIAVLIYFFAFKVNPYLLLPASVAILWFMFVSYSRFKQTGKALKNEFGERDRLENIE